MTALFTEVSDQQLSRYADLIYRHTGIRISAKKKSLLSNRLRRRLRETGIPDFDAYFKKLSKTGLDDPEWDAFLQEITTHETYLFRDEGQWDWFRSEYLSEITSAARRGERDRTLRIWSAASSTGDEAYTIACLIANTMVSYRQWKIEVIGTDIGIDAIEKARQAHFSERAMRLVPDDLKRRWFKPVADEPLWEPSPRLRELVHFQQHNLLERLNEDKFDLVFVKNVLIYFDGKSKRRVVDQLKTVIKPDGMLVTGPAEGISSLLKDLEQQRPWLYRLAK